MNTLIYVKVYLDRHPFTQMEAILRYLSQQTSTKCFYILANTVCHPDSDIYPLYKWKDPPLLLLLINACKLIFTF